MSKRVPYEQVEETIRKAFIAVGMDEDKAATCAAVHAESSAAGVESHGLNRVPRFVEYARKGWINLDGEPQLVKALGAVENYDGQLGIGVTNALFCTDRAMQLAKEHGIGCVTLRNTTHWMRGGTYAWRMAEAGYLGMNWINTESCMPMWGSVEPSVGNNPFCVAIPRENGPVVVDMAMSQYAYGKLGVYRLAGKKLPFPGGFDSEGNLTDDPGKIEDSMRILPTGYWKGSSLAIALDLAAALMSNGMTGSDMDQADNGSCGGCSQVFIAFDPDMFGDHDENQAKLDRRIDAVHNARPENPDRPVAYPGEHALANRERSHREGVVVDENIWSQVCSIAEGNLDVADIASK
ncbi:3-dehydro-L-gulonate 2-dehydrogenase [Bifidobacterium primatium]|uniref:3-dehydro-L-gulonate 2-dehydrogenase n=1 Tax=Bifidobacterium primatium TaxID=2045438 RepID=A0A2M9H954_9BIFI|nr:3-dehydro-L-gulonate 2-dehydrogenase [Bifidobacterium primatium]PJM73341.1 3-dehydro-L-gulonate 2-dehydrogenase [Bifidobacterium primatium]